MTRGAPRDAAGRFLNSEPFAARSLADVLRWQWRARRNGLPPAPRQPIPTRDADLDFIARNKWLARRGITRTEELDWWQALQMQGVQVTLTPEAGGGFDIALLPIGAYAPRWFMAPQHVNPEEAVRIHRDLGAKRSLGVHWGTFELTDEPLDEPPRKLAEAVHAQGLEDSDFGVIAIGETLRLPARHTQTPQDTTKATT